jgi:hypothetical protein
VNCSRAGARSSGSTGVRVTPETFEHRSEWHARSDAPDAFSRSAQIHEGIPAMDPELKSDRGVAYNLAGGYFGMKRYDLAEPWLKRALELPAAHAAQGCGSSRSSERARNYR